MADSDDVRIHRLTLGDLEVRVVSAPEVALPASFTAAEREVARMALDGLDNEAIARARGTSVRTVANQLRSIYGKVGVVTREELAAALFRRR